MTDQANNVSMPVHNFRIYMQLCFKLYIIEFTRLRISHSLCNQIRDQYYITLFLVRSYSNPSLMKHNVCDLFSEI